MSTPTDKAEDTAIDAEIAKAAKLAAREAFSDAGLCARIGMNGRRHSIMAGDQDHSLQTEIMSAEIAIRRERNRRSEELEHYLRYFESLAKVNAAANAALDTARREWAKRGEG